MCWLLKHLGGNYIRQVSDAKIDSQHIQPEGIHTQVEDPTKTKTEFHKAYTSPIKQKRADRNSPVESFYQDADGDWKKIVKTPDFEFSHIDGVVSCCIRDESENKVVATIEELEGTK